MAPSRRSRHSVRFPVPPGSLADDEYFLLDEDGAVRQIRLFDYQALFRRPGLYEQVVHERLHCRSPKLMAAWLAESVAAAGGEVEALRILDVGAGNGCVGEELARLGVARLVGVDVLAEAKLAAYRDRPGVYDAYHLVDPEGSVAALTQTLSCLSTNCLVAIAALGPEHLPADAFITYFDLLDDGGWLCFNIRADFVETGDARGFAALARDLISDGCLEVHLMRRYTHRRSIHGDALDYLAVIGRKVRRIGPARTASRRPGRDGER